MDTHIIDPVYEKKDPIGRLRTLPFVALTDEFLYSPAYFILIGVMAVIANLFSAELIVYTGYILIGLYISFFGKDYLPIIPIVICCYIAPSVRNNPGRNEASIFFGSTGLFLVVLAAIFVISLVVRLALDPHIGRKAFWIRKRKLLPGMLALGAAYLLSGAGSGHSFDHGHSNLLFAAIQFLAVFLLYFILSGAVKWEEAPRRYFAWTGICVGFVLLAEILGIYLAGSIIADGEIDREKIYTGWGHYNNIGALLAMMIPFAFHLACVKRRSWIYNICGVVFLIGVFMTCSRASTVFAVCTYIASCLVVMFKSRNRRVGLLTNIITGMVLLTVFVLFHDYLLRLFSSLLSNAQSLGVRLEGYKAGIQQFLDYPLFGGTFYPVDTDLYEWSNVEAFCAFFPARWHNTIVQIAASAGIAGLAAYAFHRLQTILLVFRKPSVEVICIGISIAVLLLSSLLDCHLFNVGPTLFYSMALSFAENCPTHTPKTR